MTLYHYFILLLFGSFLLACNPETPESQTVQLKEYYYPIDSLKDGWVYEYADKATNIVSHFWFFKTVKDEAGDRFLVGVRYNAFYEQSNLSREWIVANGVISKDYKFFVKDSLTGKSDVYTAEISENVVFPFEATKDSVMAYRFSCKFSIPPDTNLTVELVRDRRFSHFDTYTLNGEEVETAVFKNHDLYDIEDTVNGGFWNVENEVTEVYAKGYGLVFQSEKTVDETNDIPPNEFYLSNIYTMEEFLDLQAQMNEKERETDRAPVLGTDR